LKTVIEHYVKTWIYVTISALDII